YGSANRQLTLPGDILNREMMVQSLICPPGSLRRRFARRGPAMFPLNVAFSLRHGLTRPEMLHVGGLSLLGLPAADLAHLRAGQRRASSCVFFFLFGGPSQFDLWDMKPAAPVEVRGEFTPTASRVPGIHLCEHLPGLARVMDRVCVL